MTFNLIKKLFCYDITISSEIQLDRKQAAKLCFIECISKGKGNEKKVFHSKDRYIVPLIVAYIVNDEALV